MVQTNQKPILIKDLAEILQLNLTTIYKEEFQKQQAQFDAIEEKFKLLKT